MRYLGSILIAIIVPSLFVGTCLYYLIFMILADQIAIPEAIASTLMPSVKTVNAILITGFPLILILLVGWGVFVSHRLAGPIKRLERELDMVIEEKKHTHKITLRKDDDLRPLADKINTLIGLVRKEQCGQ
jgi:signal transduction histidine kinase